MVENHLFPLRNSTAVKYKDIRNKTNTYTTDSKKPLKTA